MYKESDQTALAENNPVVAVDVRMGDKFSNVDFDYMAFMQRASVVHDMPSEDIAALSINIRPHPFLGSSGNYFHGSNKIIIKKNGQQPANNTLRHELQHAADHTHGLLELDGRMAVGNIAMPLSAVFVGFSCMDPVVRVMDNIKVPASIEEGLGGSALLLSSLALWGYSLHPSELRARKAGKDQGYNIITLEKRSLSSKLQRFGSKLINSPIGGAGGFTIGTEKAFDQFAE